jgi:hypothetical protein
MVIGAIAMVAATAYSVYSARQGERAARKARRISDRARRATAAAFVHKRDLDRVGLAEQLYRTGRGDTALIQDLGQGVRGTLGQFQRRHQRANQAQIAGYTDAMGLVTGQDAQMMQIRAGQSQLDLQNRLITLEQQQQMVGYGAKTAAVGAQIYDYFQPKPWEQYGLSQQEYYGQKRFDTAGAGSLYQSWFGDNQFRSGE